MLVYMLSPFNTIYLVDTEIRNCDKPEEVDPLKLWRDDEILWICRGEDWYAEGHFIARGKPYIVYEEGTHKNLLDTYDDFDRFLDSCGRKHKFVHWRPEDDGITHINVYSKGKTLLGRMLSNFSQYRILLEEGSFASIEAYWYWLLTGEESLKEAHGFKAKSIGSRILKTKEPLMDTNSKEFQFKIRYAIWTKINTYPKIRNALMQCKLPMAHYYVYGDRATYAGYEWITQAIEKMRLSLLKLHWGLA